MADADVAKGVALQIAKVFAEVVPYWDDLSADQKDGFAVEIVDEADQTILTVPFEERDSKL